MRLDGLDVARAVAIGGMLVAHFVTRDESGSVGDSLRALTHGRAMPLFVLLGGVGVTLLIRSRGPAADRVLAQRGLALVLLGLTLQEASDSLAIILVHYGVLFVAAIGLRRLPSGALVLVAVAITAVGAVVAPGGPPSEIIGVAMLADPAETLRQLVADGYYPLAPMAAFFVIGLVVGRLDLGDRRTAARLAGGGALVGLTLPLWWSVSDPGDGWDPAGHSGTAIWVLTTTGLALAVLDLCLLAADHLPDGLRRALADVGRWSLTLYVAQALVHRWGPWRDELTMPGQYLYVLGLITLTAVLAREARRRGLDGPFETTFRALGDARLPSRP